MNWEAVQDGYVITANMTNHEVWKLCQLFGAPALADALEDFIDLLVW